MDRRECGDCWSLNCAVLTPKKAFTSSVAIHIYSFKTSRTFAKRRKWLRLIATAIVLSALALVLHYSFATPMEHARQSVSAPIHKTSAQSPAVKEAYRGLPVTLKIPAINVDTSFEYTGLTTRGDMTAPTSPSKAGWYKYGAIPGDIGSAVIAGHVVGEKGEPAVFARLNTLQKGDLIVVVDSKGQTASFVVREVRTYNDQDQHDEVFTSSTGTHLNIITCAGEWDSSQHHYLERLVVFADKTTSIES